MMSDKDIERALREAILENRFESIVTLMSFLPRVDNPSMITSSDASAVAGELMGAPESTPESD